MFLALIPVYNSMLGRSSIRSMLFSPLCGGNVLALPRGVGGSRLGSRRAGWRQGVKCADLSIRAIAFISGGSFLLPFVFASLSL